MKRLLFWLIVVGGGRRRRGGRLQPLLWFARPAPASIASKTIRRGDITLVVNSTGTVQPVLSVQVGAVRFRAHQEVYVDFNDKVKKGQLLAQIDPRIYKSALAHEEASLAHSQADLVRVKALLEQAMRDRAARHCSLKPAKAISETDLDQNVTDRKSLEAQVKLAEAAIEECEANLAYGQDEPRIHQHPLAGRRHRDRPQGRSGPDRGRPVPDAGHVRRRPGSGEEGLCLRLGRRGRHRPDPRGPGTRANR